MAAAPNLETELQEAIEAFDRAFAAGDLEEFSTFFADDARLLIHNQEVVTGREAIRASFEQVFSGFDTSAYEPRYEMIDVHGDQAYALASFNEVLRPKTGQPGIRIRGRNVQFWRRQAEEGWRIVMLLTARAAPEEPEA